MVQVTARLGNWERIYGDFERYFVMQGSKLVRLFKQVSCLTRSKLSEQVGKVRKVGKV